MLLLYNFSLAQTPWQSKFVKIDDDGKLTYVPDAKGNIIPDFSRVGYHRGDIPIPAVRVVKTITSPGANADATQLVKDAITEVSNMPIGADGFRGAILFKAGTYRINGKIQIKVSGIVLRGEGNSTSGTVLIDTDLNSQHRFIEIGDGTSSRTEVAGTRVNITDAYVPVGATTFTVADASNYNVGDDIIVYRPATANWIHDLKMDQIPPNPDGSTLQWTTAEYHLSFERKIEKIEGNKITIENPIVMAMETNYGGGQIYKFTSNRIKEIGIEDMYLQSAYRPAVLKSWGDPNNPAHYTYDEQHGWHAVYIQRTENAWVKNITAQYFGFSAVTVDYLAKCVTVIDSKCINAQSNITGSRRYSFNTGQAHLCLFKNLETTDGRHDFVSGNQNCGPHVFTNCKARVTYEAAGPHHRWSTGYLYDMIDTDGELSVQDNANYGTGHGWIGANIVFWNCKVNNTVLQSPWVSAKNYGIGIQYINPGVPNFPTPVRPNGEWENPNTPGLTPASLYEAQVKAKRQPPLGQVVVLKANNEKYVTADRTLTSTSPPMTATFTTLGTWQHFTLEDAGTGLVSIKGSNGRYVCSKDGLSDMLCDKTTVGSWEKFTVVFLGYNSIALKGNNGKYVSSNNGTSKMRCDKTTIGPAEIFTWSYPDGSTTVLSLAPESGETRKTITDTDPGLVVYPNPAENKISIEVNKMLLSRIYLSDMRGTVYNLPVIKSGNILEINVSSLIPGTYLLNIVKYSGEVISKKIIKN